ncbi:MAG: hypothetical protein D6784_08070 [Chloroflexi bacterium]|nr:MAG: hypothetical protein D6784_08070 [Chloroflexota bacterium]
MKQEILYDECPLCVQGQVSLDTSTGRYGCDRCGLTLQERSRLGIFRKGQFGVVSLGQGQYSLVDPVLKSLSLKPERLEIVLGNMYPDDALAQIAAGNLEVIRPVRTVLAQILLEQLHETCYFQVQGLREAHGQPLTGASSYRPAGPVPRDGLEWQKQGNLFGTTKHLVLPSNTFTFIRLDRKLAAVQAFTDGVALQRKGEDYATYFVGCYPHEAALVAAFVLGKLPALRGESS